MGRHRAYPNLKTYLRATGTSQGELARRLGVDRSHISHILRGRRSPSLEIATRIADLANVPIESLLKAAQ